MRQIEVVEIFCDVNLDQYDRAIEESFTNLAFEAVEKIIKVTFRLISPGDSRYLDNGLVLILPSIVHFRLSTRELSNYLVMYTPHGV